MLGTRSGIDWIIDRYYIKTDKDSGIVNDPNQWGLERGEPRYIVDLIKRVVTVSVRHRRDRRGIAEPRGDDCAAGSGGAPEGGVARSIGPREERKHPMADKRAFISFDFDHDEDLRNLLVGQAKNPGSPFSIQDWSLKESLSGDWKAKVCERIRRDRRPPSSSVASTLTRRPVFRLNSISREKRATTTSFCGDEAARPAGSHPRPGRLTRYIHGRGSSSRS